MRPSTVDPTAGERGREIRMHPSERQVVIDPTDPRCGTIETPEHGGDRPGVFDPTDPACATRLTSTEAWPADASVERPGPTSSGGSQRGGPTARENV